MTYFKKKKHFSSQEGRFSNFSTQKPKKIETPQNKENAFSKKVLDIFCRFKTT
jgi:hypothetical protein